MTTEAQTEYLQSVRGLDAAGVATAERELAGRLLPSVDAPAVLDRVRMHIEHAPSPLTAVVQMASGPDREAAAALASQHGEAYVTSIAYRLGYQRSEVDTALSLVRGAAIRSAETHDPSAKGWSQAIDLGRRVAVLNRRQPR